MSPWHVAPFSLPGILLSWLPRCVSDYGVLRLFAAAQGMISLDQQERLKELADSMAVMA